VQERGEREYLTREWVFGVVVSGFKREGTQ
jgi:hypothetical protein